MNKILLIGRVGTTPEIKEVNGLKVSSFSLATSEKFTDKNGEKKVTTDWHRCVVWGKSAEIICKYVEKGSLLHVEGKQRNRKYEKDGNTSYISEVQVMSFEFLSSGKNSSSNENTPQKSETDFTELNKIATDVSDVTDLPF